MNSSPPKSPGPPQVLVFAASDPSSGAGIQADILTLASLGCHPLTALTAITVQDTVGVQSIHPVSAELLEQQARERLNRLQPTDPLLASLRTTMARLLPEGKATLASCALRLHCSQRTLQRKLQSREVNFQTLLDEVRMQLADTYLADPNLKLAEMALLLGFADQAAFTHAFTRWTGMPPARWRAQMHEMPESRPSVP